jgi:hypothetical protein
MNIYDLLSPKISLETAIPDEELMQQWQSTLEKIQYKWEIANCHRLTDMVLTPLDTSSAQEIPVHLKVISKHMNGSFRCHIGKNRPIQSTELYPQMRLLLVFFKTEQSMVSPEFIFFPTWLLHLFKYTQYESAPGRTDIRFLKNEDIAREDHIYRLNHVLNRLFKFNIHSLDTINLKAVVDMADFLFDTAGLDYRNLPKPTCTIDQPAIYLSFLILLYTPRPKKIKPLCLNCHSKPASRRQLCVACYRYQLKHGGSRPLRLIIANRSQQELSVVFYSNTTKTRQKQCVNCQVTETHQWYRNLCGSGNWCETCKSYYLRHRKVRPPELFQRAAKRKINVRNLINCYTWSWDDVPFDIVQSTIHAIYGPDIVYSTSSSRPETPPPY